MDFCLQLAILKPTRWRWRTLILRKLLNKLNSIGEEGGKVGEIVGGRRRERGDSQCVSEGCVAGSDREWGVRVQMSQEVTHLWQTDQRLQWLGEG